MQISPFGRYMKLVLDRCRKNGDPSNYVSASYNKNKKTMSVRGIKYNLCSRISRERYAREQQAESEHRENERSLRNSTRAIAWLTGVLSAVGIASAIFSALQWIAISGQLDAMEADQRPWVSVFPKDGFSIIEPLTFDAKTGAGMRFSYKLRNTGKSPALHVRIRAKIVILPMKTWENVEMAKSLSGRITLDCIAFAA